VIGLLSTIVIWPMALASIAVFQGHPVTYWSVVNCVLFPALLTFSIAIHEAGHAIAACMVGLRVAQVEVGVGRRVARWRWRETTIVVHALPFGGFTRPISVRVPESRWRYAACVAAGPLATLAIVVAVMFWPTPLGFLQGLFPTEATAGRFAARDLLAFINITALAAGVIPSRSNDGTGANDGMLLVGLLRRTQGLDKSWMAAILQEARESSERDDHEGARRLLEGAMQRAPDEWVLRHFMAVTLMDLGRFSEARDLLVPLLEDERVAEQIWIVRNNIAWVDFLLRDDGLRAEADEHSAAVAAHYRDLQVAPALGTRGAVLFWLGRPQQAIGFLESAYHLNSSLAHRAVNACCLAMSMAALKRWPEAEAWLSRAVANDASCLLLHEARAALAARAPSADT
jgi:hypothetical protein